MLIGTKGNDTLDGGTGSDQMWGGPGNDTYFVDNIGDVVTENANEGNDVVHASIDYTIGANVESLILDGTTINGAGNGADNAIIGNAGDNIIDGRAGADFMQGGAGNDIYFVDNASDAIVENPGEGNDIVHTSIDYTIGANIESLILDGTTINGAGNGTDNAIIGNASDNIIDGRGGSDFMQGGAGNDIYFVDNAGDAIVENPGEGNDIVHASIDYTIGANIESLILDGTTINGAGNGTDNAIIGNASDNIIDGRGGSDFMQGGAGNDIYFVDNAGDAIVENPGEGNDIVHASISYTIGANIESLILDGSANLAGAGNSTNNALVGNSGDNNLDGRGGQDFLTGNGGNDTFEFQSGEAGGDVIADFNGNGAALGDGLLFIGFGTAAQGATFTQVGATNQWQIHSGLDAHDEVITLQNSASVHASDYLFI
jgi:Ca2+-binding RTX toxin-like protein